MGLKLNQIKVGVIYFSCIFFSLLFQAGYSVIVLSITNKPLLEGALGELSLIIIGIFCVLFLLQFILVRTIKNPLFFKVYLLFLSANAPIIFPQIIGYQSIPFIFPFTIFTILIIWVIGLWIVDIPLFLKEIDNFKNLADYHSLSFFIYILITITIILLLIYNFRYITKKHKKLHNNAL